MSDAAALAAIAGAFVIVASSPGPANLAAATVAMAQGRRTGMIFALGLSAGLWVWGLLAATGLGAVLQTSATVLGVLKVLGGLYLLWLAFGSARAAARPASGAAPAMPVPGGRWFWRGLALNLTNPKAVFAWMAALSVGLDRQNDLAMIALATAICGLIALLNAMGHVWLFSFPGAMAAYRRARAWIEGTAAVLFSLAGLGLIRSALAR